ncbi:3-hydroxy-9,10-secoandrosta-1,3,5(10)-triene-9,17-dione monooxygenase oxygenase subunit [Actinocrispum wychmicini]|uniref:3-hydroxy-9,10-secoandrosta-1,3,5(10)-triene-9, 17-dione monooxygenase n=1 Tax=Actinocrispum wychmicini TaxID=1213861 RepID=A0A4V2S465_9PSEU|nr:3-hydroxy-9,10-secoandrosta-1,3,5(10)-triene-9,17-dione monooxygenase oxygenase subunit [Actinocrispum wychmicini]TCO46730.1 3-hydroxy-9,10-secoandrosta-1,3,5(10)-triene-9,17-dione monooxygenase [Actinocrispum wychmicini]
MSEVVAAVRELRPVLRERAQETEDLRRIPAESIEALRQAGFFKLLQPTRHGGLAADPLDFYRAVRLIASACGSTGWVSSVLGVHPWQLGLFAAQAQDDVWGEDQDARISSSYAPMGRATPVDGGFRFSGRWSFSSGCDHASWVFLGGLVLGDDGNPVDFRTFLLPLSDYKIEDVWDTVGLRGTGSNDILVDDVFVPEYRTLSFMDTGKCVCPGQAVNPDPLYKLPFASVFSYSIAVPVIGMATGAYESHVSYMAERVRASYGTKAAEDPYSQVRVAEAASDIDAAWLQLEHNIGEEYRLVVAGEKIPIALRLKVRRDQVRATTRSIGAVDKLFENSGGKALNVGTPIQRFWRDAHAGRVHAINDPERALAMFGKSELGLKVQDAWL